MATEISAYSQYTGLSYPNWAALVEAEANGYVVVGTIIRSWGQEQRVVPVVCGPFTTEAEAKRARVRLRNKWKRDSEVDDTFMVHVRPLWKEQR